MMHTDKMTGRAEKVSLRLFRTWWGGFVTMCAFVLLCEAWAYVACSLLAYHFVLHWKHDLLYGIIWAVVMTYFVRWRLRNAPTNPDA